MTGLLWLADLAVPLLFPVEAVPEEGLAAEPVRPPGAVLVTVAVLPVEGLDVTVAGFFDAAVCLSLMAADVLVILFLLPVGRDETVAPEDEVFLLIGRLLTELPPRSELLPANTLSDPVLCRVPVYMFGLLSSSGLCPGP